MGCGSSSQVASLEKKKAKHEDVVSSDDEAVTERPVEKHRKSHDRTRRHKEEAEEISTEEEYEEEEEEERVRHSKRTSSGKSTGSRQSKGSRKHSGRSDGKKRSVKNKPDKEGGEELGRDEWVSDRQARKSAPSASSSRASSGGKSSCSHSSKGSAKERRKVTLDIEDEDDIPDKEGGSTLENSVDEEDAGDEADDRSHSARSKDSGFADEEEDDDCCHVKFITDESSEAQQQVAHQMGRPPTPDFELCGTRIEGKKEEMLKKQKIKKKRAREEKELMQLCQTNAVDLPPIGISRPKSRGGGLAFDIEIHDDGPVKRPKTPSGPNGEIQMPVGLQNRLKQQDRSHIKKKPKDISDIQKKLIAAERRKQKQERDRLRRIEAIDKSLEVESSQKMQTIKARQTETKLENKINKVELNRDQVIAERKAKLLAQQSKMQEVKRRQKELKAREKAELHGEDFDAKTKRGVAAL